MVVVLPGSAFPTASAYHVWALRVHKFGFNPVLDLGLIRTIEHPSFFISSSVSKPRLPWTIQCLVISRPGWSILKGLGIKEVSTMAYAARFEPADEGGFIITIPDFGWGVSQGDSEQEAREMAFALLGPVTENDGLSYPTSHRATMFRMSVRLRRAMGWSAISASPKWAPISDPI